MRIEGKSLCRADVEKVNHVINKHWDSLEATFLESREDNGPSIEVLVGGQLWEVSDRLEPNATFYLDNDTIRVACRELFNLCEELKE